MQQSDQGWHAQDITTVLLSLGTDRASGLPDALVSERRATVGMNVLPEEPPTPWWVMLLRQFRSPLVYVLVLAAGFTLWLGEWIDTSVILLSVAVNTIIGFYQEYRANNVLAALKRVVHVVTLVRRDGQLKELDASELVPGDLVELKAGSKVPADCRLLAAHQLTVNEAVLTGESSPVKKATTIVAADADLADRANMVWMGTIVESGNATAVVVETGEETSIGKIAELSQQSGDGQTPLMERLARVANLISVIVGVSGIFIFLIGMWRGLTVVEVFTTAVAVAVSAIPEGLVAALSVVLAVSTSRILASRGLVRRPVAAETLGSVTVICTDKTGTLTEGVMRVEKFFPSGDDQEALRCMVFANEAAMSEVDGKTTILGEATDRAKWEFALTRGWSHAAEEKIHPPLALLSFDSREKYIAAARQAKRGVRIFVSGAAEQLLAKSMVDGSGAPLYAATKQTIEDDVAALASQGYRMIGLADRTVHHSLDTEDDQALRAEIVELTWRGYVAIRDPLRPDVPATMEETRRAGVRVVMVTGDHRLTAVAVGKELGFRSGSENIVSGAALDSMSDEELARRVREVDVFDRVNPEHKLRIVAALKANGESVAMTGDGVNDAPALSRADIGVAVGSATDVTKEAADLVLLDDSFTTIVNAIREGRVAFDNIRKVTILLLSGSFSAFLLVVVSLVLGTPLPLAPVMILWANLVENGLPNFALAYEPAEKDVMSRPPVSRHAPVLDGTGKSITFGVALIRDCLLVGLFLTLLNTEGYELARIQTMLFAMLSTDSLAYIFSVKSFGQPIWKEDFFDNWFLLLSIAVGFVLVVAAVYVPFLNGFLGTVPLSGFELLVVVGLAAIDIVLIESVKWVYRLRQASRQRSLTFASAAAK